MNNEQFQIKIGIVTVIMSDIYSIH